MPTLFLTIKPECLRKNLENASLNSQNLVSIVEVTYTRKHSCKINSLQNMYHKQESEEHLFYPEMGNLLF